MIWVIANKAEEDGSFPTYKYYKQAYDEGMIDIYLATPQDRFGFIERDDIVIVRTRDQRICENLREAKMARGFASTVESWKTDWYTHDKEAIKVIMANEGVHYPKTIQLSDVNWQSKPCFVKPRYGENSIGVDSKSVCHTAAQVKRQCMALLKQGIEPMVEEYLNGIEVTTAVFSHPTECKLRMYSAIMRPITDGSYHTAETKRDFAFVPERYDSMYLHEAVRAVFHGIGARHLLRIDSRIVSGRPYIIDVNMIPGLAPNGYMSKCMEVNGVDYHTFIRMMVNTAW